MAADPDHIIKKVQDRVFAFITEKRVRLEEFFYQFDRLRQRYVTPDQFRRGLYLSGSMVTDQEFNALVARYADRPGDERVNYRAFCDDVTKIERDLEKKPLVEPAAAFVAPSKTETLPPAQERRFSSHLLPKLRKIVRERGWILKDYFIDFDPHRNGRVTQQQFRRCLPFHLPIDDVEILIAKYADPIVGDVNYRQMHVDTQDKGFNKNAAANPATAIRKPIRLLTEMEKEVKALMRDKRLRLYEFFEDFDKLRSGLVTLDIFQRVVCMAGLEVLRDKLPHLADLYRKEGSDMVDYVSFCREMQATPGSYHELLQGVIQRMRKEFAVRGPVGFSGLQRALESADETGRGELGPSLFVWVLTSCGLRVSHDEVFALLDYFDVKNDGVVKIGDFLAAVRGTLAPARTRAVSALYHSFQDAAGEVTLDEIVARFDSSGHPSVLAGDISVDEAMAELENGMPYSVGPNGMRRVSLEDLCAHFALLSVMIDTDDAFDAVIHQMFPGRVSQGSSRAAADNRVQPWASPTRVTARAY